ncbi:hypothetical protein HDU83_006439 [Entophlyctis luteolus]|nr:hypothetical protein HDU83_006439 [Entophlyctis luteolus]
MAERAGNIALVALVVATAATIAVYFYRFKDWCNSGSGKSTLLKRIFAEFPSKFGFSVSREFATNKFLRMTMESNMKIQLENREKEKLMERIIISVQTQFGKYYLPDQIIKFSVTKEIMVKEIAAGKFIESAQFSGNYYGTSFAAIQDVLKQNKSPILDIDMQGVKILQAQLARGDVKLSAKPLFVFLAPPSVAGETLYFIVLHKYMTRSGTELEKRLTQRGTESAESLAARLAAAKKELEWGLGSGSGLDHVIVNDNVDAAYAKLKKVLGVA